MSPTESARELIADVRAELAPRDAENALIPLVSSGTASRSVFGLIAAEERHIVSSDQRSFQLLAVRSEAAATRSWFGDLAAGEGTARELVESLAAAVGLGSGEGDSHEPRAGCQAYPAYVAWLALNGDPSEVAVALSANFAAWGAYCATIATAMRERYAFADEACRFFDFFATPPDSDEPAVAAVAAGVEAGTLDPGRARRYARLFQSYELMFWNTLAAENAGGRVGGS